MFRQLAAADNSMDWSRLNLSLYATTFLVQQGSGGKVCTLCMGVDHIQEDCALAPLQAKATRTPATMDPAGMASVTTDPRGRRRSDQACYSWNEGRCYFPYCRYRHVCLRCRGDHRAASCPTQMSGPVGRPSSLPWGRVPPPLPSQT